MLFRRSSLALSQVVTSSVKRVRGGSGFITSRTKWSTKSARYDFFAVGHVTCGTTSAVRFLSTVDTPVPDLRGPAKSFSTPTAIFIAVASALFGFGTAAALYPPRRTLEDINKVSPQFGSARDIEEAIAELKSAFTRGNDAQGLVNTKVSTDPEDINTHGFSENDHFPSM